MGAHAAPPVRSPAPTLLFALLLLLSSCSVLSVPSPESDALLRFKASLINSEALGNWNPDIGPCDDDHGIWVGVRCSKGNVLGLQLENMGLSGAVDVDALVGLRNLRILSFQNNRFEGPLPDVKKLGSLWSLYLSGNQFSGPIPDDAFAGMGSLKKVYLSGNKFTGPIPLSLTTLPRLLELRMEDNQFSGRIPDFQQKDLKVLNVANNQLEGPIPGGLSGMSPDLFAGNKEMCGKPLDTPCNSEPPAPEPVKPPAIAPQPAPISNSNSNPAQNANADANSGPPPTAPGSKPSPLKIASISIAAVIACAAVIVVFLVCFRRSQKTESEKTEPAAFSPQRSAAASATPAAHRAEQGATPEASAPVTSKKAEQQQKLSFVRDDRPRFDLQDLLRASAEVLGSGNFGSSYKAVLLDGQAVVVKRFKQMNNVGREEFHEHMRRIGRLRHPNLLPLVAYYYRREEKLLVFDYVQKGSLASHLHGNHTAEQPGLDWPTRLKIIKGVANGLGYLHSELPSLIVPHGHLKSSNVLLDDTLEPLLMDYTLVPVVNIEQAQQIMVAYKSPEYAQCGRTTKKTDVWSLGIMILEILTGKFPANYLAQGRGNGTDLASWVNSIVKEDNAVAFDEEMGNIQNAEGEIQKLLKIGLACCEEDVEKRWDLKEVIERIGELKERDSD